MLPGRATKNSAGADLHACLDEPVVIQPGCTVMIPLGFAAQPSEDRVALLVYPRSGLASKFGICLANGVGVVDSDYRGEWMVPMHNMGADAFTVTNGMRVAQLVVTPIMLPDIKEVRELDDTCRGTGGFGSSGLQ